MFGRDDRIGVTHGTRLVEGGPAPWYAVVWRWSASVARISRVCGRMRRRTLLTHRQPRRWILCGFRLSSTAIFVRSVDPALSHPGRLGIVRVASAPARWGNAILARWPDGCNVLQTRRFCGAITCQRVVLRDHPGHTSIVASVRDHARMKMSPTEF